MRVFVRVQTTLIFVECQARDVLLDVCLGLGPDREDGGVHPGLLPELLLRLLAPGLLLLLRVKGAVASGWMSSLVLRCRRMSAPIRRRSSARWVWVKKKPFEFFFFNFCGQKKSKIFKKIL